MSVFKLDENNDDKAKAYVGLLEEFVQDCEDACTDALAETACGRIVEANRHMRQLLLAAQNMKSIVKEANQS